METPIIDAISKASALGGMRYGPKDVNIKEPKAKGMEPAIEVPDTLARAQKARGQAPTNTGPKATSLLSKSDNVASYVPSKIK